MLDWSGALARQRDGEPPVQAQPSEQEPVTRVIVSNLDAEYG